MKVKLKLHHSLKGDVNISGDMVDIDEGTTIETLLNNYGLRQSTVVVTLNNRIVPKETVIQEDEFIEIYPILIGG